MKSKPLTYLLIVSVAAVWGIIFYRIFSAQGDEEISLTPLTKYNKVNESLDDYVMKDTFILSLNYRDPFLTDVPDVNIKTANITSEAQKSSVNELSHKPAINWNIIKYTGFISNPLKKSPVAIVQVNGTEHMMKEGESMDGVKLIRILRDSVKVTYQNKTKFITIQ